MEYEIRVLILIFESQTFALITDRFSGPGIAIGPVSVSVSKWRITFERNDLWRRYSIRWFSLTISRSRLNVKVLGSRSVTEWKMFLFGYGCTLWRDVSLVIYRVLCAKVVGATSSEGFLIVTEITPTTSSKFGSEIPLGRFWRLCRMEAYRQKAKMSRIPLHHYTWGEMTSHIYGRNAIAIL